MATLLPDEYRESASPAKIAGQIKSGVGKAYNSCTAMARFADAAAESFASTKEEFVRSFAALIPAGGPVEGLSSLLGSFFGAITRSTDAVEFGATGFKEIYKDGKNKAYDQTHHFAAYFQFGFNAGALEGDLIVNVLGWNNSGDVNRGVEAAKLGAAFKQGTLSASQLGQRIRDLLCE